MADDKDAGEKAKELFVYGPIGLALYVRDTAPSFLKLFVARGRNEFDQRKKSVGDQLDQARSMGESAATTGAPQVLRLVSEGLAAVRGAAEDALGALGIGDDEDAAASTARAEAPSSAPPAGAPSGSGNGADASARTAPPVAVVPEPPAPPPAPEAPGRGPGLAIPDYDELSASQVVDRLEGLRPDELEAIRAYESAHRGRNTILGKIEQLGRTS